MESEKFDELIKRMGTGRMSRLTAVRGLAGGAVAAAAGVLLAKDEAEAAKRRGKKARRRKNKRRGAQLYVPTPAPVAPIPHADPYSCAGAKECPAGTGQVWDIYDPKCPCVCGAGQVMCENTYDSYKAGMCVSHKCEKGWHYESSKCKCVEDDDNNGGGGGDGQKCASVVECTVGDATAVACCDEGQDAICVRVREDRLDVGICQTRDATPVEPDQCSILDPRCPLGTECCGSFEGDLDGTCVQFADNASCRFPIPGDLIGDECDENNECIGPDEGGVCCLDVVIGGAAEANICVRGANVCRILGGTLPNED